VKAAEYNEGPAASPPTAGGPPARPSAASLTAATAGAAVLPDFCGREAVFAAVLLGELLAVLITLAEWRPDAAMLPALALNSLFVLWVTLSSCAVLCWLGRRFSTRSPAFSLTAAWLGILVVSWLLSEAAWLLAGDQALAGAVIGGNRGSFLARNLGLTAIIAAMSLRYLYVQQSWRRQVLAETGARMAALQARIRPHFLFNSLNTIAALVAADPARAEGAVEDLADLFRAALMAGDDLAPLGEELLLCERYLALEALRLGERLRVEWLLAEDLPRDAPVPPLILQPLLENAVYHGIEGLAEGGTISIAATSENGRVVFVLANPCAAPSTRHPAGESERPHLGMALTNIRDRLAAHYGAAAGLECEAAGQRYQVRIWWPHGAEQA
jgi:two-component system, LytTR family, sensor histidine kinase AlgZ